MNCYQQLQSGRLKAPASTLQKVSVFSATLQITSVFSATIKVRQLCLTVVVNIEHHVKNHDFSGKTMKEIKLVEIRVGSTDKQICLFSKQSKVFGYIHFPTK